MDKKKAAAHQRSIRNKYKRRRKRLGQALEDFIGHANDYANSDKTRKKRQLQKEIDAAEKLKKILPKDEDDDSDNFDSLRKTFNI